MSWASHVGLAVRSVFARDRAHELAKLTARAAMFRRAAWRPPAISSGGGGSS